MPYTIGEINRQFARNHFSTNEHLSMFTVNETEISLTPFLKRIIEAAGLQIEASDIIRVWSMDDETYRLNATKAEHLFEAALFLARLISAILFKARPYMQDGARYNYNTNYHTALYEEWETNPPPSDLLPANTIFDSFYNPLNQLGPADDVKAWAIRHKEAIRDGLQFVFETLANPHNRPMIDDNLIQTLVTPDGQVNDLYIDHKRVIEFGTVDVLGFVRDCDLMEIDDLVSPILTESPRHCYVASPNIPCYPTVPVPAPILSYWSVPCWDVPPYHPAQAAFVAPYYPTACHTNAYRPPQPSPLRSSYRICDQDSDDSDIEIITEGVRRL